jgi:thioredoxin-like negative regulator of GroEL
MVHTVSSIENYQQIKAKKPSALFYFSHEECNVCKVLKPKIEKLLSEKFPNTSMYYINTKELPELAGQERIFTVPVVLVFFDGREYIRKSRNIGLAELETEIGRYYNMMFG